MHFFSNRLSGVVALFALMLCYGLNDAVGATPLSVEDDLTACQGAPQYPCNGVNVGGWEPWWEWIARVRVGSIDEQSGKEGYHFYSNAGPATLTAGASTRIQLTPGLSWSGYTTDLHWRVYVDFNRDGDFDDAGEKVVETSGNRLAVDQQIAIPQHVTAGCTRLRVVMQRDGFADACESFSFGEVEDYLVTLAGGNGGGGPQPSSISLTCPPSVTVPQIAPYGADVFIPNPTASTTCSTGGLAIQYSITLPQNRTPHFAVGTTTVTVSATDNCGNSETCTFDVTVTPSGGGGGGSCTGNGPTYPCNGVNVGGWEPWWEWIANVKFANLDNSSAKEGFKFFNSAQASVEKGQAYTLAVTPGLSWAGHQTDLHYTAYIDFNADGDFDDAGEEVLRKRKLSAGVSGSITIPAGATMGLTRLRVVMQRDGYADACESFSFGEVEDYLVCIGGGTPPPPPTLMLNCQGNTTRQLAQGQSDIMLAYTVPTATTTCNGGAMVTRVSGPARTARRGAGTYTIKYRATDNCGNTEECTFRVTVKAPVATTLTLNCQGNTTRQIAQGQSDITLGYTVPTASTTCNGNATVTRVSGPARTARRGAGTYTIKYRATDNCGNTEECTFRVTVKAPVATTLTLNCQGNTTRQIAQGQSDITLGYTVPTASTTCNGNATVTRVSGPGPNHKRGPGTYTIKYRATDNCGNTEECTFRVTVKAPVATTLTLNCQGNTTRQIAQGQSDITLGYTVPTASTTCNGNATVTRVSGPGPNHKRGPGTYTIKYRATDNCGNTEECTFRVTVKAPVDPVCAHRTATNNSRCSDNLSYSFFGDIVRNVNGDTDYFTFQNASLKELDNGTAQLTGRLVNNGKSSVQFDVVVNFSGRTINPPAGSPKQGICGNLQLKDLYYYPTANGTLTGRNDLHGGKLTVTRKGEAFQLGIGGNRNEATRFGAAGWFTATVVSQPSGSAHFEDKKTVDFNLRLSGSATACVDGNDSGGGATCANNVIPNSGFENSGTWTYRSGAKNDTRHVRTGHRALRLDNPGSYAFRLTNAQANQSYTLQFYAKDLSTAHKSFGVIKFRRSDNSLISQEQIVFNSSSYKLYTKSGQTPAHTAKFEVTFWRPTSGTNNEAYVDDVCLELGSGNGGGNPSSCDRDVLFVVGNSTLNAGDHAVRNKLQSFGYTVTVRNQHQAKTSDATGKGLVVISSTVTSSNIGSKYTNVAVPVLTWESYLYDDLKMTGGNKDHDYGNGWGYRKLKTRNTHPISQGLGGVRTVLTHQDDYPFGIPSSNATIVASVDGRDHHPVIFAYEKGASMKGKTAPERRIGWYFDDDSASKLTHDGWEYFKNAVAWATRCNTLARLAPNIDLHAQPTASGVALDWVASTEPGDEGYLVERQTPNGTWEAIGSVDLTSTQQRTVSLDFMDEQPAIGLNSYRVVVTNSLQLRSSEVRQVDYLSADAVTVYPNPVSFEAKVSLKGFAGHAVDITVYNQYGHPVSKRHVDEATDEAVLLPVEGLPEGLYNFHVVAGGAMKTMQVMVVRQ